MRRKRGKEGRRDQPWRNHDGRGVRKIKRGHADSQVGRKNGGMWVAYLSIYDKGKTGHAFGHPSFFSTELPTQRQKFLCQSTWIPVFPLKCCSQH